MSDEIKNVKTLDARGLFCPIPVVKLASAIKEIKVGEIIEVLATDPGALSDIPAWARKTGNEVVKQVKEGGVLKFYVRRRT
jgi:tRNA 2-thiouridine synthesizing protein A